MGDKRETGKFIKKYKLHDITVDDLKRVLCDQGYTVVEFNGMYNTKDVTNLIEALELMEYVRNANGFTYHDDKYRLVFVNEALSDDEKLIVLAHEEGHIWHGHMTKAGRVGENVIEEYEANEFAHYLLNQRKLGRRRIARSVAILSAVFVVVAMFVFLAVKLYVADKYTDNLYVTQTGTKYHVKDCMYIKGKDDVRKMTKEEYESGEYEPCKVCLPEK